QSSGNLANFYASTASLLYFTDSSLALGSWSASSVNQLAVTSFSGISGIGTLGAGDTLFTVLSALDTTQAVALRFTLFMVDSWQDVSFGVTANGVNIFQATGLSGSNEFRQIEAQFAYSSADYSQVVLAFSAFSSVTGASFQWGIGQVGVAYSNVGVGYI